MKADKQEIFDKVVALAKRYMPKIVEQLGEITPESNINIDGFESLNFIMLICEIENDYSIKIPDKVWKKLRTVGDVVDAVATAVEKKK
ncbi:MAG: acyl carrier protein [Acutalibacteraceae bacterium]|mgnify:FL=1